jgi:DNA transformation protein
MKPFRSNAKQTLKSYYQVPVDIIEDMDELREWATRAIGCQQTRK